MRVNIPDERMMEIYHAVEIQLLSQREVASRFGLSPQRVDQIVSAVKMFVFLHGSETLLAMPSHRMELGALNFCYQQLCFYHGQVIRQWRQDPHGAGGARLLHSAARLAIEQAKLVGRIAKVRLAMLEEGTLEESQPELIYTEMDDTPADDLTPLEPASAPINAATTPPVGGCTENRSTQHEAELKAMLDVLAKTDDNTGCDAIVEALVKRADAAHSKNTPAHPK